MVGDFVMEKILRQGSNTWETVSNPALIPDGHVKIQEPYTKVDIICEQEHIGSIMELAQSRRGEIIDQRYMGVNRVKVVYSLPLAELVTDFHDSLKSRSSGYASMNYELEGMREGALKRMDIVVAGDVVDGYV